jgi:hypothetical protein
VAGPRELEKFTRHETPRRHRSRAIAWLLSGASAAAVTPALAAEAAQPIDQTLEGTTKGHGSVSVGYQNTFVDGFFVPGPPGGEAAIGTVRIQSISFDLDYYFADHWSAEIGIPYVVARYQGPAPHCITQAPPPCQGVVVPTQPHPESQFLDDGNYHGTWQDWTLGLAYHENINNFILIPSVTAYLPSHNYTFFANAAVGQDVPKIEFAIDLAHQFELTNVYYRIRAGHVFARKTLDQSIDYNALDAEIGYFLNETWTVKAFAVGKKGDGYTGPYDQTTEQWYHHDQRTEHNYATLGAGLDYHLNDKYTVSTTVQHLVWGQFVFDFKYSLDVHLTREF